MKALCVLAVLTLAASNMAQSNGVIDHAAAEQYIVECATDWAESVVTGDVSRREVYFAEDFQGTGVTAGPAAGSGPTSGCIAMASGRW